jgi:hypothetical protein
VLSFIHGHRRHFDRAAGSGSARALTTDERATVYRPAEDDDNSGGGVGDAAASAAR